MLHILCFNTSAAALAQIPGVFHIPYANIHEPITVYTDDKNKRQAVQYYDGLDAYIYTGIGTKDAMSYELYVAKDKKKYVSCAFLSRSFFLLSTAVFRYVQVGVITVFHRRTKCGQES